LSTIDENAVYEGFNLMRAIQKMNPNSNYKILIDRFINGFNNKLTNKEKLEIIKEFQNYN
jgi:hypothetical protein